MITDGTLLDDTNEHHSEQSPAIKKPVYEDWIMNILNPPPHPKASSYSFTSDIYGSPLDRPARAFARIKRAISAILQLLATNAHLQLLLRGAQVYYENNSVGPLRL